MPKMAPTSVSSEAPTVRPILALRLMRIPPHFGAGGSGGGLPAGFAGVSGLRGSSIRGSPSPCDAQFRASWARVALTLLFARLHWLLRQHLPGVPILKGALDQPIFQRVKADHPHSSTRSREPG